MASNRSVLLLFTKQAVAERKAYPEDLCKLLNEAGQADLVAYSYAYYEDLLHVIVPGTAAKIIDTVSGKDLAEHNFVYQRCWADSPGSALACAIYLRKKNVPFIDLESYQPRSLNKLTQHWRLWEHDLPVPATICAPQSMTPKQVVTRLNLAQELGFPLIAKSTAGTRGQDNHLVGSEKELLRILSSDQDHTYLLQQYVPNNEDYRIIVGKGKTLLVIRRVATAGTHKNNTSQGGAASLLPNDYFDTAVDQDVHTAAKLFNRDIAGVDLVFDKTTGAHYFFEVNRSPQLEHSSFAEEKAAMLHTFIKSQV